LLNVITREQKSSKEFCVWLSCC